MTTTPTVICANCGHDIYTLYLGCWYHTDTGNERCDGQPGGECSTHSLLARPDYGTRWTTLDEARTAARLREEARR